MVLNNQLMHTSATCANLCVDISRDCGGGTKLGFPLYSMVGPYSCSTMCCCDNYDKSN